MRVSRVILIVAVGVFLTSCAQQQVARRVNDHAQHEGVRYADEVAAQSPFQTLEVSWSGAAALMEERNLGYRKAVETLQQSAVEKPVFAQIRNQLQASVRDTLKPNAIVNSLQDPVVGLSKQLDSISGIKDISHDMQQAAWGKEGEAVAAKVQMRKERVRLYALLSKGELINNELKRIELDPLASPTGPDAQLLPAYQKWSAKVKDERAQWLVEVRDFFNAEYLDVRFKRDDSAMPLYRDVKAPDLSEWQRWCFLNRSQGLVQRLMSKHKESKPAVPGTRMVRARVAEVLEQQPEYDVELNTDQVRSEVRKLIRSWRGMKRAQTELSQLELVAPTNTLERAKKIYQLRHKEVEHASVVWLLDEQCWIGL